MTVHLAVASLLALAALASCSGDLPGPAPKAGVPALPGPLAGVEAPPPGTRMHRTQAGEPDATGWCVARSTEGAFSVLFPTMFNDFRITTPVAGAVVLTTDVVGTVTEHDTRFTAFRARRSDGKMHIASLDEVINRFEQAGKLKGSRSIVHRDLPGLELQIEEGDRRARLRCFKVGTTLYQLSVDLAPATAPGTIEEDIARFFGSFAVSPDAKE